MASQRKEAVGKKHTKKGKVTKKYAYIVIEASQRKKAAGKKAY